LFHTFSHPATPVDTTADANERVGLIDVPVIGIDGARTLTVWNDAAAALTKGRVSQLVAASRAIEAFGDMSERKARDLMQALRAAKFNTDAIGVDAKKSVTKAGGVDAYIANHAKKAAAVAARATGDSGKPAMADAAMREDPLAYLHDVCTRTLAFIGSDADMLRACAEALETCAADFRKAATPKPTPTPSADGKATRKTPAKV
jgi:hypothetical protein